MLFLAWFLEFTSNTESGHTNIFVYHSIVMRSRPFYNLTPNFNAISPALGAMLPVLPTSALHVESTSFEGCMQGITTPDV